MRKRYKWSDRPYWKLKRQQALRISRINRGVKLGRPRLKALECTNSRCSIIGRHTYPCKIYMTIYQRQRRENIRRKELGLPPLIRKHEPIAGLSWLKYGILPLTPKQMEKARIVKCFENID